MKIQIRRGTTAEWASANPVLASGEPGLDTTTGDYKFGDGVATWSALPSRYAPVDPFKLAAAIAETMPRFNVIGANNLVSGKVHLTGIALPASTITSITYVGGATVPVGPTNQWFGLYNASLGLLGNTTDHTTESWAAGAVKTWNLTTPVVVSAGNHYVACLRVTTGTIGNVSGLGVITSTVVGMSPVLHGQTAAGVTYPPPNPAVLSTGHAPLYAYVS